ncbi:MAG: peptide-N-glycosidase F-related protein [Bacteroidota bacterium]
MKKTIHSVLFSALFSLIFISCSNKINHIDSYSETINDTLTIKVLDYKTPSPDQENGGVYDTIAHFPKKGEWRKILMVQTIKCDASTKRDKYPCGEWDYITNTMIHVNEGNATNKFQINSFVTPYGKRLNLTDKGWEYVWDVTDYAPILKGDRRIEHGNNQELHDLKFLFIKGKPSRNVLKVENIWTYGKYKYEDLALDSVLKEKKVAILKEGKNFKLKSRISGHGHSGPYNCCEWDEKIHSYRIKGNEFPINWTVWKDCGHNPIHPQGGTWQFDRAGWCPGTAVDTHDFEITPFAIGKDSISLDYQIEMFDDNGEKDGFFRMSHQLITYDAPNFNTDAAIIEIKSPNNKLRYRRSIIANDGTPIIKVRNEGKSLIKKITFTYGVKGGEEYTNTWYGELKFLEEKEIILPPVKMDNLNDTQTFYVAIKKVNNDRDDQTLNNFATSEWNLPKVFPKEMIIKIQTNDIGRASENSYTLINEDGKLIKERAVFPENTIIADTLRLEKGLYTWIIRDTKEDGMIRHWWYRKEKPDEVGRNGKIEFMNIQDTEVLAAPPFDFADFYSFSFRIK